MYLAYSSEKREKLEKREVESRVVVRVEKTTR
jgi:hypothetical protein